MSWAAHARQFLSRVKLIGKEVPQFVEVMAGIEAAEKHQQALELCAKEMRRMEQELAVAKGVQQAHDVKLRLALVDLVQQAEEALESGAWDTGEDLRPNEVLDAARKVLQAPSARSDN